MKQNPYSYSSIKDENNFNKIQWGLRATLKGKDWQTLAPQVKSSLPPDFINEVL